MLIKFYIKLSVLMVAVFFFPATILQAQVIEAEPDNTAAQAITIPLSGNASGALNIAGDVDWYTITTTADGQLNITFDNTGNQDLKTVSLYDNDAVTVINSSAIGNGIGGVNTDGIAAGTYYIKVNGNSGTETGAYILSNTLVVPSQANDNEPNNDPSEASTLNLNSSATGHVGYYYNNHRDSADWYRVTITSDGLLQITYDNTGYQDIKIISLYDTAGAVLLIANGVGNGIGVLQKDGLAAGTYFIKINGSAGNEFGVYTISNTLITPAQAVDQEPNNIFSQAVVLALNDSITGHIGYYYNGNTDTTDWYKLTTTSDGTIKLNFDNTGYQDLKIVSLYDSNGITLINSVAIGNGIGALITDGLAAGTYYIKIKDNLVNEFGAYTITDTLIVPILANDNEPNNNFLQANLLAINDSTTGHIGYYYNNRRDTSDWYTINITRGSLTLSLDNSGNPNILTLNLYDVSGTNLVTSFNVGNGVGVFHTDTLEAGIFYVQITTGAGINSFGTYRLADSLFIALPVTLMNFDGRLNNSEVILNWSTATEMNSKGFDVQKSIDGRSFSDIGFVAGKGNSSVENKYNFIDSKLISGLNYYRLKQIDNDNRFAYSPVIKIEYSKFDWTIFGNVASRNCRVQLQMDKKSHVSIQVISIDGRIIWSVEKGNLSAGTYSIPLDFSKPGLGIYVIRLLVDDRFYTKKIN